MVDIYIYGFAYLNRVNSRAEADINCSGSESRGDGTIDDVARFQFGLYNIKREMPRQWDPVPHHTHADGKASGNIKWLKTRAVSACGSYK